MPQESFDDPDPTPTDSDTSTVDVEAGPSHSQEALAALVETFDGCRDVLVHIATYGNSGSAMGSISAVNKIATAAQLVVDMEAAEFRAMLEKSGAD